MQDLFLVETTWPVAVLGVHREREQTGATETVAGSTELVQVDSEWRRRGVADMDFVTDTQRLSV